jgi:hypothetical protein
LAPENRGVARKVLGHLSTSPLSGHSPRTARDRSVAGLGGATSRTAVRPPGRALRPARARAEQAPEMAADAAGRGSEAASDLVAPPVLQVADGLDQPFFCAAFRSSRPSFGARTVARLGGATSRTAVRPPGRALRPARARAEQAPEAAEGGPEAASDPVVPDLQSGARYTHHERYRGQGNPNPEQARPHVVLGGLREIARSLGNRSLREVCACLRTVVRVAELAGALPLSCVHATY